MPWKKGESGNPKGRKAGSVNKFSGELRTMILNALERAGGEKYLFEQSKANPGHFLTLVGKVLPLQMTGDAANPVVTRVIHEETPVEPPQPQPVVPVVGVPIQAPTRIYHES